MRIKIYSQGEFRGLLSLHRTKELGDYTTREISISEILFPYLGQFLLPDPVLRETDPFSVTDHGVIIMTENQQVLYSNEIGSRILREIQDELSGDLLKKQTPFFLQTPKGPFRLRTFPLNLHFSMSLPEGIKNFRRRQDQEKIRVLFLEPLSSTRGSPVKIGGLLSPKQQEVSRKVLQGYSNKRIAETLGITEQTVKDHLHAIFEKLRLKNRWELIVFFGGKTDENRQEE
jgi:DNA-binding CsgD family transcriptional regulator